jgi:serine phosphatase RsbU (regulator of sigma subunit)
MTGDVCGKGLPAALFMARVMTLLRSEAMHSGSRTQRQHTLEVVASANRQLCRNNHAGYFASVFFGILDVPTGLLTWINAGHPSPALARGSSDFRFVAEPRGVLLGLVAEAHYTVGETALPPGSTLLVYTDGVTEAESPDGGMFGEERLIELLGGSRGSDAEAIVDGAVAALDEFARGHPQSDDLTLLALRYAGAP